MKKFYSFLVAGIFTLHATAQLAPPTLNGQFDDISELTTTITVPFTMPDGVHLMTDCYLPIAKDCLIVPINIPGFGTFDLELVKRGTQMIIYDSVFHVVGNDTIGEANPNPYRLPMVFTRTPYDKGNGENAEGGVVAIMGYVYATQDMRGRYTSEGVYLPLISDSWDKNDYHPNFTHVLDATDPSDPKNGNKHEDGYNSIKFIIDSLKRPYDIDGDGIYETNDFMTNGRIAMFGASALGYNQYQAAAAHKIDDTQPGLKSLMPIVAPGEFYKSTGFQNGVLRDRLVTGWLKGQIFTGTDDDLMDIDNEMHNSIHSSKDYDLPKDLFINGRTQHYSQNKFDAASLAIDHFVSIRYEDSETGDLLRAGYYPNSAGRPEMDITRATVDMTGEGLKSSLGTEYGVDIQSRYTNMEVPAYHLTGWWDIFIDGQIETWANMKRYLDPNKKNRKLQKLVIGPWAHQTTGTVTTGDRTYPDNTNDIIGINFDDFENASSVPISKAINSEVIGWFRYNLNYSADEFLGEPKARIPASTTWTEVLGGTLEIRMPAEDVVLTYKQLLNLLQGTGGIPGFTAQVRQPLFGIDEVVTFDVPAFGSPLISGLDGEEIDGIPYRDFSDPTDVPDVRFYVIGPNDDPANADLGSYWFASDTFPLPEGPGLDFITRKKMYLHQDGALNESAPVEDEGYKIYVHDPDDPIYGVGGSNMIVRTPDGERTSQGQFNLKDPRYAPYTIDRQGIIAFEGAPVEDSLCIIGFPTMTLYAKSNPGGAAEGDPTDTDFMVRIVDVYPDGREYFVIEGCVNARARDYVRNLVEHPELDSDWPYPNDQTPFTNIEAGKIYEYVFPMPPIAYTFGDGHKIKILISSSIFSRFQVNPNLPIEDGEFFRRKPGDGQTYVYQGVEMAPRIAVQRVHFSPEHPTNISLPIYTNLYTDVADDDSPPLFTLDALVYPNPAQTDVTVFMNKKSNYVARVMNIAGDLITTSPQFSEQIKLDVNKLAAGLYFVEVMDAGTEEKVVKKINVL